MRLIGLTGGIATGKSTVARMLAARGAAVVDADALARDVVVRGTPGFDEVVRRFGRQVLDLDGDLDRSALATVVFADAARRAELEAILHPRIRVLMAERVRDALATAAPLVVADIPLLFERGRDSAFPATLLVYAPPEMQLRRLGERDGLDAAAARSRLAAQMPIDDKRQLATWVVDNSGDVAETEAAVGAWWAEHVSADRGDS